MSLKCNWLETKRIAKWNTCSTFIRLGQKNEQNRTRWFGSKQFVCFKLYYLCDNTNSYRIFFSQEVLLLPFSVQSLSCKRIPSKKLSRRIVLSTWWLVAPFSGSFNLWYKSVIRFQSISQYWTVSTQDISFSLKKKV